MRTVTGFDDYELIDADGGERLERWKDIILIRVGIGKIVFIHIVNQFL